MEIFYRGVKITRASVRYCACPKKRKERRVICHALNDVIENFKLAMATFVGHYEYNGAPGVQV